MRGTQFAELAAFVAIAERSSFARAADHLAISRPTLSQTLRALEDRLGVRLLQRTTRSVALTDAGKRLLARVRPALAELGAATDEVHDTGSVPSGPLRIVMLPPVADLVVGPLAARFLAAYPKIRLELSVSKTPADIVREGFDAGIRLGEQIEHDMVSMRVTGEAHFGAFASPAYLARQGKPATPRDLRDHECVRARLPDGAIFGWEFVRRGKIVRMPVEGRFVTDDIALTVRTVRDGFGIGYGLLAWIADDLAAGRLVTILDDWAPRMSGYFLYHPDRRQLTPALRAFIDFLRTEAPPHGPPGRIRARRARRPRHRLAP